MSSIPIYVCILLLWVCIRSVKMCFQHPRFFCHPLFYTLLHFPWRYVQVANYLHGPPWSGDSCDPISGPSFLRVLFSSSCYVCDRNNLKEGRFVSVVTSDTFHIHDLYIQFPIWFMLNFLQLFIPLFCMHLLQCIQIQCIQNFISVQKERL